MDTTVDDKRFHDSGTIAMMYGVIVLELLVSKLRYCVGHEAQTQTTMPISGDEVS